MRLKKKLRIAALFFIVCAMMLTACGSSTETETNTDAGAASEEASSTADETAGEETAEDETAGNAAEESPSEDNTLEEGSLEESNSEAESSDAGYDPTVTGTYPDGTTPEFSGTRLRLTVNGEEEVVIALYDNSAADALVERLPLENLSFFDLSGIEKPIEQLEEPLSMGEEEPGYDPVTGEMTIYRPWGNFTIFYGDFRYSDELVPLGKVESGLEAVSEKTEDFSGTLELMAD